MSLGLLVNLECNSIDRREWILRVLQASSAVALTPAAQYAASNWTPQFFSPAQNEAVVRLGERIIPGSEGAGCSRVIDLVMTVEDDDTRQQFLHAIAAFDGAAQAQFQSGVAKLTPEQQDRLLSAAQNDPEMKPHFELLKEWLADTYWSSEQGLHELGWNGRLAWPNFTAACEHPS